ncbi:MAG TPA: class I SAM-dependent methyltransferase [Polyangia bacterium]|nr:class I SAM-dependent methyltransferase [Polyangia bacterium]
MSIAYQSARYALLNTPVETDRHVIRVMRHLAPAEGDRILEVGCGRGFVTARVQRLSPRTQGVDVNPEAVRHGVADNLRAMSATRLDFPDASFDKVYSFHTIEHVAELGRALAEMARVLRPGGRLMLVYPAEPVRGLYAVPAAVALFHNPLRAREMHLHRLTPGRILALVESERVPLAHVTSKLELWLTPQFVTLLSRS